MSEDIGPGDVVEAIGDEPKGRYFKGYRDVVLAVLPSQSGWGCSSCGEGVSGFTLEGLVNSNPRVMGWCVNHWRKVGGGKEETIRMFEEDLNVKGPVLEPA